MDSDAAEGSGTLNALYGSVANRQTRRAVNPFPSGVVGSTPTWPTIYEWRRKFVRQGVNSVWRDLLQLDLETGIFNKLVRIK